MPLFAKKISQGQMCLCQSVYNYDLGGSQIKKDYFWHTNPKIEKRSTWNFSSNHFEHRLLGTMTTSNWRKKRNFAGSCCCLRKKICQFQNYIFCRLLHCTLFLATVLLFTTVSRLSVFLVTVLTAAAVS